MFYMFVGYPRSRHPSEKHRKSHPGETAEFTGEGLQRRSGRPDGERQREWRWAHHAGAQGNTPTAHTHRRKKQEEDRVCTHTFARGQTCKNPLRWRIKQIHTKTGYEGMLIWCLEANTHKKNRVRNRHTLYLPIWGILWKLNSASLFVVSGWTPEPKISQHWPCWGLNEACCTHTQPELGRPCRRGPGFPLQPFDVYKTHSGWVKHRRMMAERFTMWGMLPGLCYLFHGL